MTGHRKLLTDLSDHIEVSRWLLDHPDVAGRNYRTARKELRIVSECIPHVLALIQIEAGAGVLPVKMIREHIKKNRRT